MKSAASVRQNESASLQVEEGELVEVIGALTRALSILERDSNDSGDSGDSEQLHRATNLLQAFKIMVSSSMLDSHDASALTTLVQRERQGLDDMDELGPPRAAYENQRGTVVDMVENLKEKAEAQLHTLRIQESNSKHANEMLSQSLRSALKTQTAELSEKKKQTATSRQQQATAQQGLNAAQEDLKMETETLSRTQQDCSVRAQQHDAERASRTEEMEAITKAKKVIQGIIDGVEPMVYPLHEVALLQMDHASIRTRDPHLDVVQHLRALAEHQHSSDLAQLAFSVSVSLSKDIHPFKKVRNLIKGMINRLESDASQDARHQIWCDMEMNENHAKKEAAEARVDTLTANLDEMTAMAATKAAEVAVTQAEISDITQSGAEATRQRASEAEHWQENKVTLKDGLSAVKEGLRILREYYDTSGQHEKAAESASVVGLLEVVESDLASAFSKMETQEDLSKVEYAKYMSQSRMEMASKLKDVEYKQRLVDKLNLERSTVAADLDSEHVRLNAVLESVKTLVPMCMSKQNTYEGRKETRQAEIQGLKEALAILSNGAESS